MDLHPDSIFSPQVPPPNRGAESSNALPPIHGEVDYWYRKEWASVLRLAKRLGVAESDAEDVAQDVFVLLSSRVSGLNSQGGLQFWLRAVTFRICSNHRRRTARRRGESLSDWEAEPGRCLVDGRAQRPDECCVWNERLRRLEKALAQLDRHKREVFELSELSHYTAMEIAQRMQVSPNTVSSRLRAARRLVARRLRSAEP